MKNEDFNHSLLTAIMIFSFFSLIFVNSGLICAYAQADNNSSGSSSDISNARIPSIAIDGSMSPKITKDNTSSIAPLNLSLPSSVNTNWNSNSKTSTPGSGPTKELLYTSAPLSIKIISHSQNQTVPANKPLEISGVSSDNGNSNCAVYVDWNDLEPMQITNASGPGGVNDYSIWTFTYDNKYHLITEGTNELTSKLDCGSGLAKYYTVNVTGESEPVSLPINATSNSNSNSNSPSPFLVPVSDSNNNNDDGSTNDDNNEANNEDDEANNEDEESRESSDDGGKEKNKEKGEKNNGKDKGQQKGPKGESKGKGPKG
jgi:hypothetical protein